jgi:hypothetical protein
MMLYQLCDLFAKRTELHKQLNVEQEQKQLLVTQLSQIEHQLHTICQTEKVLNK